MVSHTPRSTLALSPGLTSSFLWSIEKLGMGLAGDKAIYINVRSIDIWLFSDPLRVDVGALKRKHTELQRTLHPDKFSIKSKVLRSILLIHSSPTHTHTHTHTHTLFLICKILLSSWFCRLSRNTQQSSRLLLMLPILHWASLTVEGSTLWVSRALCLLRMINHALC